MIYTSYFAKIRSIREKRPKAKFISIAGKCPDWYKNALEYKKLAPKLSWWKEWHDKFAANYESEESKAFYAEKYQQTVLDKLLPHEVKADLYELAQARDVILICYETPEKFCHRHLVCDWLNKNGIKCCEWNDDTADQYGPFARITLRDKLSPHGKIIKTLKTGIINLSIAENIALEYAEGIDAQLDLGKVPAVKKMVSLSSDVVGIDYGSRDKFIIIDIEDDNE